MHKLVYDYLKMCGTTGGTREGFHRFVRRKIEAGEIPGEIPGADEYENTVIIALMIEAIWWDAHESKISIEDLHKIFEIATKRSHGDPNVLLIDVCDTNYHEC